jgi:hypothetical protein
MINPLSDALQEDLPKDPIADQLDNPRLFSQQRTNASNDYRSNQDTPKHLSQLHSKNQSE